MSVKVKKRCGEWEKSNLFQKKSKISTFFDKSWQKKAKNVTASSSTEWCSVE